MPDYRVYMVAADNHIKGAPHIIACADDHEAIQQAKQFRDDHDIELWSGNRFVIRIKVE